MSIVEITVFHLVPDADEGSFLAADRRVQAELVPFAPGFIRRTTAREGVAWLVLTLWGSEADAEAYAQSAQGEEAQVEFERHIDPSSVRTRRFTTLD